MNIFEFQFRWGRKRGCFGIDVNAASIEMAVTKANRFFAADEGVRPTVDPDAKRMWVHAARRVTALNIGSIHGPLDTPQCRNWT